MWMKIVNRFRETSDHLLVFVLLPNTSLYFSHFQFNTFAECKVNKLFCIKMLQMIKSENIKLI